jgi:hypothetical protein
VRPRLSLYCILCVKGIASQLSLVLELVNQDVATLLKNRGNRVTPQRGRQTQSGAKQGRRG